MSYDEYSKRGANTMKDENQKMDAFIRLDDDGREAMLIVEASKINQDVFNKKAAQRAKWKMLSVAE